jgi:hypothetical protein
LIRFRALFDPLRPMAIPAPDPGIVLAIDVAPRKDGSGIYDDTLQTSANTRFFGLSTFLPKLNIGFR